MRVRSPCSPLMNSYQVINLETNEIVCSFLSNASDWEGLLYHMNGWAKGRLPWQWGLQKKVFGEWETIMNEKSSPEYVEYKKNLSWLSRVFGLGRLSFNEFCAKNKDRCHE